ncbi:MAG: hypothetical protein FJW29_01480 [Acidobacteria bacterium]|nr:hypothetical protein [Acidobacteriota bacterium]
MQSRQYRAGDALDDYCPRERRVTEHAVVALVEGTVERTRCVACDVEHEYRHGRAPAARRARVPATAALYAQVLEAIEVPAGRVSATPSRPAPPTVPPADDADALPGGDVAPAPAPTASTPRLSSAAAAAPPAAEAPAPQAAAPTPQTPSTPQPETPAPDAEADDRPFRRTLLRAQLPRHEGQVATTRAIPELTMHQPPPPRGQRHRRFGGRPAPGFEGPMRSSRDFSHSQGRGPVAPPQGAASSGEGQGPAGGDSRRRRRRRKKPAPQG